MTTSCLKTLKKGKFYYPSSLHYNKQPNEVNIICNRCQRQGLSCCIGYKNSDLCMNCAETIIFVINNPPDESDDMCTFMQQDQFMSHQTRIPEIRSHITQRSIKTIKHGKFYYPASMHYNKQPNIICDMCQRQQLSCCIGYNNSDICMKCVEAIISVEEKPIVPPSRDNRVHTYMQQSQFNRTRMFQDQFG